MTGSEKDTLSSVERAAAAHEARLAKYKEYDADKAARGYDVDGEGKDGTQFQENMVLSPNIDVREYLRRHPDAGKAIADDTQAVTNAVRNSPIADRWEQREIYTSQYTQDLADRIVYILQKRGIWNEYGMDEVAMRRLIKVVPCLYNKAMDEDRGTDCMLIFHDPETFAAQEFPQTYGTENRNEAAREGVYWQPETDTIVNIDFTANLGTKFSAFQGDRTPQADFFIAKTGNETNHYLRQKIPNFPEEIDRQQHVRDSNARLTVAAARIVNIFLAKSGKLNGQKLDHVYSPERDAAKEIEAQRAAIREKQTANMDKNAKEREKKRKRQEQSEAAKRSKQERKSQQ